MRINEILDEVNMINADQPFSWFQRQSSNRDHGGTVADILRELNEFSSLDTHTAFDIANIVNRRLDLRQQLTSLSDPIRYIRSHA